MRVGVQPKSYSSSNSNQSFSFNGYSEAYAKSIKEIRNVKNKVDIEKIYNNLLKNVIEEPGTKTFNDFDMISSGKPLEEKLQEVYDKGGTIYDSYNIPFVKKGERDIVTQLVDMVTFKSPSNDTRDIRFGKDYKGDMFVSSCNGNGKHYTMTVSKKSGNLKKVVDKNYTFYNEDGSVNRLKTLYKMAGYRLRVFFFRDFTPPD